MEIVSNTDRDYYGILGIPRCATVAQIKVAFRKLALIYHPDKNGGCPIAAKRYVEVKEAHDVLSDSAQRRQYNQKTCPPSSPPKSKGKPAAPRRASRRKAPGTPHPSEPQSQDWPECLSYVPFDPPPHAQPWYYRSIQSTGDPAQRGRSRYTVPAFTKPRFPPSSVSQNLSSDRLVPTTEPVSADTQIHNPPPPFLAQQRPTPAKTGPDHSVHGHESYRPYNTKPNLCQPQKPVSKRKRDVSGTPSKKKKDDSEFKWVNYTPFTMDQNIAPANSPNRALRRDDLAKHTKDSQPPPSERAYGLPHQKQRVHTPRKSRPASQTTPSIDVKVDFPQTEYHAGSPSPAIGFQGSFHENPHFTLTNMATMQNHADNLRVAGFSQASAAASRCEAQPVPPTHQAATSSGPFIGHQYQPSSHLAYGQEAQKQDYMARPLSTGRFTEYQYRQPEYRCWDPCDETKTRGDSLGHEHQYPRYQPMQTAGDSPIAASHPSAPPHHSSFSTHPYPYSVGLHRHDHTLAHSHQSPPHTDQATTAFTQADLHREAKRRHLMGMRQRGEQRGGRQQVLETGMAETARTSGGS